VNRNSKPFGWGWAKDARHVNIPVLSDAEALSFHLVDLLISGLMPDSTLQDLQPYFRAAGRKLNDSAMRSPLGSWPARIRVIAPTQPLISPKVEKQVRNAVTTSLLRGLQLNIRYRDENRKWDRVHPLGLVQHGSTFYVPVRFEDFSNVRTLALHRIKEAAVVEEAALPPAGFTLDAWISAGAFGFGELGKPIRLVLDFYNDAGEHLLDTPLALEQEANRLPHGRLRIQAEVNETERLKWWLLGFGDGVEVIKPRSLRREMAERLRSALARY
jgi:predicted DNA-binding transcriptional regulator YafY